MEKTIRKNKKTNRSSPAQETSPLVSIVVPVFNAEKFITETIRSVQKQTYRNWELIMVDDGSSDESAGVIKTAANHDHRIRLLRNQKNSGAATARNKGISVAKGRYICFIDADDLWRCDKLKLQLEFMKEKDCAFSFTGYEFADSGGRSGGKKVSVPQKMSYKAALKNTTIFVSTVMLDMEKLKKEDVFMPRVPSEDTACWWKILKKIDYAYGLNKTLSVYRRSPTSHSANKIRAIRQAWNLYRRIECLSFTLSVYYFCWYAVNAVRRRI